MEATADVLNLVIPGVGTIAFALQVIAQRCVDAKEASGMCKRIHDRLYSLHELFESMAAKQQLPTVAWKATDEFRTIVEGFLHFLEAYEHKNVFRRLMGQKKLVERIQRENEAIDGVFQQLQLSMAAEVVDWRQRWQQDQREMQELMAVNAQTDTVLLEELSTVQQQVEALTVLQYEIKNAPYAQDPEHKAMHDMFTHLVRVSRGSVATTPEWFLHEGNVEYDEHPFSAGAFGTVHHGTWGRGTDVVIKRLRVTGPDDIDIDPRVMEEFTKEANIWYRLRHPHIIQMYGACHVSRPPFIVCEHATNGNLVEYLHKPENRIHTWMLLHQASTGLYYLHENKFVHGDLKCNNVLVGADGLAKLADFGFSYARTYSQSASASVNRAAPMHQAGACRWRAPECFRGRSPTFASDVYSFAMCILEAVTQAVPWGILSDDDVRDNVKKGVIPERPEQCEMMTDDAWQLIRDMTLPNQEERPSIAVVADRLLALNMVFNRTHGIISAGPVSAVAPAALRWLPTHDPVKPVSEQVLLMNGRLQPQEEPPSTGGKEVMSYLDRLIFTLRTGPPGKRQEATQDLWEYTKNDAQRREIIDAGAIEPLLDASDDGIESATGVLEGLTWISTRHDALETPRVIQTLAKRMLDSNSISFRKRAANAISNLTKDNEIRAKMRGLGVEEPLRQLARYSNGFAEIDCAQTAQQTLANLAHL